MECILVHTAKHMPGECKSGQGREQMEALKKVAKMALSFVIVFVVCWLPRHIYVLWYHFDPGMYNLFWHIFKIIGFCLMFINSCINPLALYFLGNQFRRYYNNYLFCCCVQTTTTGPHMDMHSGHGYTMTRRNSNTVNPLYLASLIFSVFTLQVY